MNKTRIIVNVILGSMITALGLSSCEGAKKYGPAPMYGPVPDDEIIQVKYGVNPDIDEP